VAMRRRGIILSVGTRFCVAALLALSLGACNLLLVDDANTFDPDKREEIEKPPAPMNPGDVEAQVYLDVRLSARSQPGDNVVVDQAMDVLRERTALMTVQMTPPYPENFWLVFELCNKSFLAEVPIVVRTRVFREIEGQAKEELGMFSNAAPIGHVALGKRAEFDVFAGLDALPESLLVTSQIDVYLLPEDTDIESIDLDTVSAPPDKTGAVIGPPVRINIGERAADL